MLRIGIIGGGQNIQPSIEQITGSGNCLFQGYFDSGSEHAHDKKFDQLEELLEISDAFYVFNPADNGAIAEQVVRNQKHLLIESPFAPSSEAGSYFMNLVREADVKVHISNPNRYNDALYNTSSYFQNPVFIEGHRLHNCTPQTKDLSLVLNVMIHDIDIILHVVKSNVKLISANGARVVSADQADIVNARIEFENGCIANLTASRINTVPEHKINFYQPSNFITVDYLKKQSTVYELSAQKRFKKKNEFLNHVFTFEAEVDQTSLNEFQFFAESIQSNKPTVSMVNCLQALEIAYLINEKVQNTLR